ncbi:MAG: hypothetical protein L0154_04905 [Chloroflexi bacterium]|nr:hypothetical protein [Chloroflexota bacterium]
MSIILSVSAFVYRPLYPALFWADRVNRQRYEDIRHVLCQRSAAERFTFVTLPTRYPGLSSLSLSDLDIDRHENIAYFSGAVTYSEDVEEIRLIFVIDPEGESDFPFGCILNIGFG